MGASLASATTCSTRSSRAGWAQWRSSITTTSGSRSASTSRNRRTAQTASSEVTGSGRSPISLPSRSATRSPSRPGLPGPEQLLTSLASAWSGESAVLISAARRTISATGQKLLPSASGEHWPYSTVAASSRASTAAATSRDLPTPAGPSTVSRWQVEVLTARWNTQSNSCSSASRPTRGLSERRACPRASGDTSTSRQAPPSTGGLALRPPDPPSTSAATRASRERCQVRRSSRTSPGPAAAWSRVARLTASPMTSGSPPASSTITSPVLTPMRTSSAGPPSGSSSATASCMAAAALTARRASSSRTTGTPKTATTASPMNFCTSPWWRSSTALVRSK